ncbi:hypothetical protein CGLO_03857 [Colletotrichum gloeosporioides Cg-14]|uniref:Uncharacterized protein n=1 Tax=Colletotrichum gloeosporioides (strain Cg-14) TaxID=1237896 RepID=T0KKM8_COLGC|nr:hypothetical protein CGLO_03857 [Colletotrichum gloeosporioides Cg-14]
MPVACQACPAWSLGSWSWELEAGQSLARTASQPIATGWQSVRTDRETEKHTDCPHGLTAIYTRSSLPRSSPNNPTPPVRLSPFVNVRTCQGHHGSDMRHA